MMSVKSKQKITTMRNIHILPTEKPSKLFYNVGGALLFTNYENHNGVNIYITSDEEIKEGGWCYQVELNDGKVDKCYDVTLYHTWTNNGVDKTRKFKKIILTTDQDLIKDGVQAIDNKFLEWFVKNSSCESVEVETVNFCLEKASISLHQIITPKEIGFKVENGKRTETFYQETKQETFKEVAKKYSGSKKAKKIFSKKDMQSFIKIRNYFGDNDKTSIEHFAYSFLDGFIKKFKNK
jgi:hypothetical protein